MGGFFIGKIRIFLFFSSYLPSQFMDNKKKSSSFIDSPCFFRLVRPKWYLSFAFKKTFHSLLLIFIVLSFSHFPLSNLLLLPHHHHLSHVNHFFTIFCLFFLLFLHFVSNNNFPFCPWRTFTQVLFFFIYFISTFTAGKVTALVR